MKILSIETSCDDTCISILEMHGSFSTKGRSTLGGKVLANSSNSQINVHIPYGGVYPVLAKREHAKNLPILLKDVPVKANLSYSVDEKKNKKPVDAIAVTYGPGLEMCLWEGITFAKDLAKKWKVPLVPVNHMEGHIFSVFGKARGKFSISNLKFPMLSLLVSGGHTQLVLSKKWMNYEIVGETLDDAVGEAFDKVARMLDLPYPGGPQISKLAEEERRHFKEVENFSGPRFSGSLPRPDHSKSSTSSHAEISLPRPMLHSKDFNFSYAGLKTAVLYLIRKIGKLDDKTKSKIALEFENAAIEPLVLKTKKAMEKYGAKTLIVAGGVACNTHLQREMKSAVGKKIKLLFPKAGLAGDNSLMIGIAGYLNYIKNKRKTPKLETIKATGNLRL